MFEWIASPEAWIALATLTALEIVLGIDNIIFISILSGRLPKDQRPRARTIGLAGAMLMRVALLLSLAWIARLTVQLFTLFGDPFTARDVVLVGGGLFLLGKATFEIHHNLEGEEEEHGRGPAASFAGVIAQIMLLDIVFSLDSVITAIGMAEHVPVMVAAVVIAVIVMMIAAGPISDFVEDHPTIKILALAFLLLIGMSLVAEGFGQHIPKPYIYFAMSFSVFVEMLNLKRRSRSSEARPVRLRQRIAPHRPSPMPRKMRMIDGD
jgi:predicted tellurium resistance membrane protein TerC